MASTMSEKISIFGHDDSQHTNNHALIVTSNGRVFSTGYNNYGLADISQISTPTKLPIADVKVVAATQTASFFLKNDGTVWGASSVLGTTIIDLGFTDVTAITAWDNTVYCIKNNNTLWYKNGTGAITQDSTISSVKQFARGLGHYLYLSTNGVVTATGNTGYNKINGANGLTGVQQMDATGGDAGSSYFLKEDGTVWVCGTYWGYSGGGSLIQLPIENAIKVCAATGSGDDHSHFFVLRSDGALFAGGYGNYGVLGTGNTTRLQALTDTGLRHVKDVSTGGDSTFITLESGEIFAFGYNGQGQLGIGNTTESILTPTKVLVYPSGTVTFFKNGGTASDTTEKYTVSGTYTTTNTDTPTGSGQSLYLSSTNNGTADLSSFLTGAPGFTADFWIKRTSTTYAKFPISFGNVTNNQYITLWVAGTDANQGTNICAGYDRTSNYKVYTYVNLVKDTWNHVVIAYRAADKRINVTVNDVKKYDDVQSAITFDLANFLMYIGKNPSANYYGQDTKIWNVKITNDYAPPAPSFYYLKNGVVNTLLTGLSGTMMVQDPFGLRNVASGAIGTVINGVKKFFTIASVSPALSLSEASGTVAYPNTKTFTVSREGTGTITVNSSNSAVATAQISGNTVTITTVKPGSAIITVNVEETTGYFADQATYNVTVTKGTSTLTLSKTSGSVNWNSSDTFTVTANTSGGALSVTPTNNSNSYVNATVSDSTITVTGRAYTATAQTITVTSAETDYYNAATATYSVTINRTSPGLTISKTSATIAYPNTDSFTWSRSGSGTVTASSNQTGIATTSNPNSTAASGTITITSVKPSSTKATITVSVAASGNYLAESKTYVATINKGTNTLTLSASSGSVDWNGTTTFSVTTNTSNGTLSVSPTGTTNSYLSTTINTSTKVITITGKAYTATAQTITVTSAATDYYNSATTTYSCTVSRTAGEVYLTWKDTTTNIDSDWSYVGETWEYDIHSLSGGTLSVTPSGTGNTYVTCSITGTVLTVIAKKAITNINITVTSAAAGNYNAASTVLAMEVKQADPELQLSQAADITWPTTQTTFTLTKKGSGKVTITSNDTNVATVSPSTTTATTATVTVTFKKPGTTSINVSVAELAGYYNAQSGDYVSVYADKGTPVLGISDSPDSWEGDNPVYEVDCLANKTFTVTNTGNGTLSVGDIVDSNTMGVSINTSTKVVTITGKKYDSSNNFYVYSAENDYWYQSSLWVIVYVNRIANNLTASFPADSIQSFEYNQLYSFTMNNPGGGTLSVDGSRISSGEIEVRSINQSTGEIILYAAVGTSSSGDSRIIVTAAETDIYNSATFQFYAIMDKATPTLTLSKASETLSYPSTTTFTITTNSTGTLSVKTSNSNIATASLNNKTVTVTPVKPNSTSATITVSVESDTNYRAASTAFSAKVVKGTTNTLTLSKTSGSLAWNGGTTSFTITNNSSGGTLSVSPTSTSQNAYVTAALSGTTVNLTGGSSYTATAQTITVTSAATDYYESKTATFSATLNKIAGSVTLSATSGSVNWNDSITFTVTGNTSGGALSVSSNATSYATASISGSTVTVTGVAYRSAAVTITVTSAANGGYNAATATYSVSVKQTPATFNLSAETVSLAWNSQTTTVNVTDIVGGTLSASSASTTYLTASANTSTKVVTITSKNSYTATALKINVTVAASGNYSATTKQITVNLAQISPNLTLSKTSATLAYPNGDSFTWSRSGSGKVTATSGATGTVTCNNPNSTAASGTITVTAVKPNATAAVITVSAVASGGYLAESKTYTVTLNKGTNTLELSASSGTVTYGTPTTFTVTTNTSNGALSVASANSSYVTASINTSTKVVTLNCVSYNTTVRNITVTSAATDYYNSQTAVYAATSAKGTPTITISPTASTVEVNQTQTITVTSNVSGGTITAKSANTTYATVTKTDNTTFVVTAKAYQASSTNITFDIASTTNYAAATTVATYALTPARIPTSLTFNKDTLEILSGGYDTFTVTRSAGSGTLSVSSNNTGIATASVSGTTVTVNHVSSGSATITVNCAENGNYSSCTKTITVTCLKALDEYTWGEINTMTMDGTLMNYCSIGDYKIVTVDATIPAPSESSLGNTYMKGQMRAVLVGYDHNSDYEGDTFWIDADHSGTDKTMLAHNATFALIQDYNGKPCAFIAPQGNALLYSTTQTALVGSTNTGTALGPASWWENQLRTRVMNGFKLVNGPATLVEPVKATSLANKSNDKDVVFDWPVDQTNMFFLPSEFEVSGGSKANDFEKNYQKKYAYFTAATQRTLYGLSMTTTAGSTSTHLTASTTTVAWFTRSFTSGTAKPVIINTSGASANGNANTSYGIVPFFMIGDGMQPGRMSWRAIHDIQKYHPELWEDYYEVVGIYKWIHLEGTVGTLALNGDYVARCIGRDHNSSIEGTGRTDWAIDRDSTGNKCIAFVDSKYNTSTTDTNYFAHINGNWFESNIRTNILPQFFNVMPANLQACIAYTTKYAAQNGDGFQKYRSKIWTFSQKEGGGTSHATDNYNVNYGKSLITTHYKHNATTTGCMYWVRPTTTTANYVSRYSAATVNNSATYKTYSYGIIPCFSIGDDSPYCELENYTWSQLKKYAEAGEFPNMFEIGDYKTVTLNGTVEGTTYSNAAYKAVYIGLRNGSSTTPTFMIDSPVSGTGQGVYSSTTVANSYQLP